MKKKNKIDEETFVKKLYGRHPEAIGALYDQYSAVLYGIIYRIVNNPEVAEEVLMDTFSKIWNNFQQYDASKGRLLTWMINLARNSSLEKVRPINNSDINKNNSDWNSVFKIQSDKATSYDPETIGIDYITEKLEPEYKMIIDLLFFHGLSQSEVAEKLNIPLGTVKSRSRAAIQKIQLLFQSAAKT